MRDLLWEDVNSSTVEAVAYNNAYQQLFMRFQSDPDQIYMFQGVPPDVHHDLVHSESIGSYFNKAIKPKYDCYKKVPATK